ncbi:MAG: hypothetical protein ACLFT3_02020 [Cyclobacteriaceae bacterium]
MLLSLTLIGHVSAQDNPSDEVVTVKPYLWKINFLLPGFEYERRLGNTTTLNANPYFDIGYSSNFILGDAWLVQPSLDVQLRQYYNLHRRFTKGKRVAGNSANFLALSIFGVGRSIVDRQDFRNHYYYGLGPVWGFQRTFRSRFNLSFSAGPAFTRDGFRNDSFILRLNLRLGLAVGNTFGR